MPRMLELLRWKLQLLFAWTPTRTVALNLILGVYAFAGWGAFANKASINRELTDRVNILQTDRDRLVDHPKELEQANLDLVREWQAKLASAREELSQTAAARDAAKAQLASSQRAVVASRKRVEQARDRVSETGSIKSAEPPKRAAGKQ